MASAADVAVRKAFIACTLHSAVKRVSDLLALDGLDSQLVVFHCNTKSEALAMNAFIQAELLEMEIWNQKLRCSISVERDAHHQGFTLRLSWTRPAASEAGLL